MNGDYRDIKYIKKSCLDVTLFGKSIGGKGAASIDGFVYNAKLGYV